jgi:hypothetical protein
MQTLRITLTVCYDETKYFTQGPGQILDSIQRALAPGGVTSELQFEPNWEDLLAYCIRIHPHDLIVLTNATPDQMDTLVPDWNTDPNADHQNIEDFLRTSGYYAITGQATPVDETLDIHYISIRQYNF